MSLLSVRRWRIAVLCLAVGGLVFPLGELSSRGEDQRGPFTHAPRSVRSREVDQKHIRLDLKFDFAIRRVTANAELTLSPYRPISRIELDAVEMEINEVRLVRKRSVGKLDNNAINPADGEEPSLSEKLVFSHDGQTLKIDLGQTWPAGEEFKLSIDYILTDPRRGVHFVEPDEREPHKMRMAWTQCEPEYARFWFPCLDTPSDRVTSQTVVTVPSEMFVLSNGELRDKRKNADGTITWHWWQRESHVPYLISVVAGEFEKYEQEWDGLKITSYVPKGRLDEAERSFQKTARMIEFMSERVGYRYPWEKYSQICVDEYGWGGMEHTSASTLNLNTLHDERAALDRNSDNLIIHELSHQWFGNLVTCKDWAELWLNESFASYFEAVWMEHDKGEDEAAWFRHQQGEGYFAEDRDRYRRAMVNYRYEQPENMFDRHTYPKGSRILHTLRRELGDELFWKAVAHYLKKHEYQVVETADFRIAIEEATGQGMQWFFEQWVYRGGHPEFEIATEWNDAGKQLKLTVKQTQKVSQLTPLFRASIDLAFVLPGETQWRRIIVSQAEETFHFELPAEPRWVEFDPRDDVLKKLVYRQSKEALMAQLKDSKHAMWRYRAAEQLAAFTGDERVRLALVAPAIGDSFWAVRMRCVQSLAGAPGREAAAVCEALAVHDRHPQVRRAAVESLAETRTANAANVLRQVIARDQSYATVAAAVRSLAKVAGNEARDDLLAAIETPSDREVVLAAAADGLADLRDREAFPMLERLLGETPSTADRRIAVMQAVARLGGDSPEVIEALIDQLGDVRIQVRRAAINALSAAENPAAIEALKTRRKEEKRNDVVRSIDETIDKLEKIARQERRERRAAEEELKELRERVEALESRADKAAP